MFSEVIEDPEGQAILDDLDLAVADLADLFDVIDADGNGTVDVAELVAGLLKVRGPTVKSDMVASRLAVRSMQKSLQEFQIEALENQEKLRNSQELMLLALSELQATVESMLGDGEAKKPRLRKQHAFGGDQPASPLNCRARRATFANPPSPCGARTMTATEQAHVGMLTGALLHTLNQNGLAP